MLREELTIKLAGRSEIRSHSNATIEADVDTVPTADHYPSRLISDKEELWDRINEKAWSEISGDNFDGDNRIMSVGVGNGHNHEGGGIALVRGRTD